MRRYETIARVRRRAGDDDNYWYRDPTRTMDVLEDEREPQPTGLVDKRGNAIVAVESRDQIGFIREHGG